MHAAVGIHQRCLVWLQDILETWRLRTPNEWERLGTWAGVLLWRNSIYNSVISSFKNLAEVNPVLHQLGYRDKAWSVNKCVPASDWSLQCSDFAKLCIEQQSLLAHYAALNFCKHKCMLNSRSPCRWRCSVIWHYTL